MRIQAKTLIGAAALVLAGVASAGDAPQNWSGSAGVATTHALTRAEVVADLVLWQRAGLQEYTALDTFDPGDAQYQQRLAAYHQLRNSPAYLAEVQRQGGADSSSVAGTAAARTAH